MTRTAKRIVAGGMGLLAALAIGVATATQLTESPNVQTQTFTNENVVTYTIPDPVTETTIETTTESVTVTAPATSTTTPTPARLVLWGASTPPRAAHGTSTREEEARWLEGKMGRKLGITRHYVRAPSAWTGDGASTTVTNGRIPIVTVTSGGDSWAQVANGSLDSYWRTQVQQWNARGGLWCKGYVSFENEPEAETGAKGTPAQYRAAYEHLMGLTGFCGHYTTAFMEFTWQSGCNRPLAGTCDPEAWVPNGIDTLGVHVYFTRVGTCGDGARTFASGVDGPYATATAHGLRMGIWEWGYSSKAGTSPDLKANFFRSIPGALAQFPRIDAMTYWDQGSGKCADANSYYLDQPLPQALQGWVDAGHAPILGGS